MGGRASEGPGPLSVEQQGRRCLSDLFLSFDKKRARQKPCSHSSRTRRCYPCSVLSPSSLAHLCLSSSLAMRASICDRSRVSTHGPTYPQTKVDKEEEYRNRPQFFVQSTSFLPNASGAWYSSGMATLSCDIRSPFTSCSTSSAS